MSLDPTISHAANDPSLCCPALWGAFLRVQAGLWHRAGLWLWPAVTHRGQARQEEAKRAGKSKAGWRESLHNLLPSAALDAYVVKSWRLVPGVSWAVPREFSWDAGDYAMMGELAKQEGLIWGGDFRGFFDGPHLQALDGGKPEPWMFDLVPVALDTLCKEQMAARARLR